MGRARTTVVTSIALSVAMASLGVAAFPAQANVPIAPDRLSSATIDQIDALTRAKMARSATDNKIDSRLLTVLEPHAAGGANSSTATQTGIVVDHGRTELDLSADVSAALVARIRALGGTVKHTSASSVRAEVPVVAITPLAARADVLRIAPAVGAMTMGMRQRRPVASHPAESKQQRRATISLSLRDAIGARGAQPKAGAVTSQGVAAHAVDKARERFKVSGVGVKVGVLSDGVDSLSASQASGDLPPEVDVIAGQAGEGDEGTAMLEIVHDLAPGAELAFATAFNGPASFADNIRSLRAAGADIIVDDVIYFDESPFQDGQIAQAVNQVTRSGALYFSSAGNEGNLNDGTSGVWEGDFSSSGRTVGKARGIAHDFDPSSRVQIADPVSDFSIGAPVDLFWSDRLGRASDDYDLYILDGNGNVAAFSNNIQNGHQDPYELTFVPFVNGPIRVVVVKFAGQNRFLHLDVLRGRFAPAPGLQAFRTAGQTRGHSSAPDAFSVAAVPAADPLPFDLEPGDPPNPSGPFPNAFTAAQRSERFTSDGPRRVFYRADGSAITPGNFSATGGKLRLKPDISAADGVSTSTPFFSPFFGTSASAPHAAAIAALVLSGNPTMGPAAMRTAITLAALDIEVPGRDRDTGPGIIMANRLLSRTGATPQPLARAQAPVIGITTDGDGFLEPGEDGVLSVPVTNVGDGVANNVSVRLTSSTPGVSIWLASMSRSYGNLAVGETKSAALPWVASIGPGYPLGAPIALDVVVSFDGVLAPTTATLRLATGEPSATVVDVHSTGGPRAIPDGDLAGVSVPLVVSGVGPLSALNFSIDGSSCNTDVGSTTVGIDHTWVGDLVATLRAPTGQTLTLFANVGQFGVNFCQVVFDDNAPRSIDSAFFDEAPFTGSWQPAESLAQLSGVNADGTWMFNVADLATGDTGSVRAVSLHLRGFVPPP